MLGMEITAEQFALIEHCLPRQRGNVSMTNLQIVNAVLYVAEHGCKWRGLPKRFGNWHTVYARMRRWTKAGVRCIGSPEASRGKSFARLGLRRRVDRYHRLARGDGG